MTLLSLCLATALGAAADAPPPVPRTPVLAAVEAPPRLKLLGLMASAGAPDGAVVSLVARPVKWVRADAGYSYNYFMHGVQGGLTLVPFHWAVVPTLRGEVGRFFKANANDKAKRFGDVPAYVRPFLDGVGYDYASVQLGLELGSERSFVFFLRGGLAWLKGSLGDGTIQDSSSPNTNVSVSGLTLRASGPTASLGFLFYVW